MRAQQKVVLYGINSSNKSVQPAVTSFADVRGFFLVQHVGLKTKQAC